MRAVTAFAFALIVLAGAAAAQEPLPRRTVVRNATNELGWLTAEDRNSYCFWAGELYSIGASFCTRQQTLSTCSEVAGRRPMWVSKENDKFCDKNPSFSPQ